MDIEPITFPAVTNREAWSQLLKLMDVDENEALDLDDLTFVCEVRRTGGSQWDNSGYGSTYSSGSLDPNCQPMITLTNDDGITVVGDGEVEIYMTVEQMRTLAPDTYSIAMTARTSDASDTRQVFLGRLPVIFGGVT